jgi:hypothetical protein
LGQETPAGFEALLDLMADRGLLLAEWRGDKCKWVIE